MNSLTFFFSHLLFQLLCVFVPCFCQLMKRKQYAYMQGEINFFRLFSNIYSLILCILVQLHCSFVHLRKIQRIFLVLPPNILGNKLHLLFNEEGLPIFFECVVASPIWSHSYLPRLHIAHVHCLLLQRNRPNVLHSNKLQKNTEMYWKTCFNIICK